MKLNHIWPYWLTFGQFSYYNDTIVKMPYHLFEASFGSKLHGKDKLCWTDTAFNYKKKNRTVFLQYRHFLVSLQSKLCFIYNFILIEVRFSLQMPFLSLKLDPILCSPLYWFELSYAESLSKSHSSVRCTLNKIAYHEYNNCWYLCLFELFQLLKFWRSDRFDISNIYSDERP